MAWTLHGKLTLDALEPIGWRIDQINKIVRYINEVDVFLGHGRGSCHRVGKYQKEFEAYGGMACHFKGGEESAAEFLEKARKAYLESNEKASKYLGYSLHFVQDALCPEHIFSFQEKIILGPMEPHLSFMLYSGRAYYHRNWPELARNAAADRISGPKDLSIKLTEAADWIRNSFPCSYRRNDGVKVIDQEAGDLSFLQCWKMSDEYIGKWIEKTSSLTKGAVLFCLARPV